MSIAPSRAAVAASLFLLSGCGAHLKPLNMTEASRSISSIAWLPHKQTAPVQVRVLSIDDAPTADGKYTYPLKKYYQKAFKDAMAAAFAEGEDSCSYLLEITANKSQLETSSRKAKFEAVITSTFKGPDDRVRGEAITYKGEATSGFDRHQVPEAVWSVAYTAAKDLLKNIRGAHWFKVELQQPACQQRTEVSLVPQPAAGAKAAPVVAEKARVSDVDTPNYTAEKEYPDDYAIVIGIDKYQHVPEAAYAERDAAAVKEHLMALGYPERNIILLTGAQAGKSSISKYVDSWLPKNLKEDSRLFFFFSGHGAPVPETGDTYLLPWDADPAFLESTAYSKKALYSKLNALPAKQVIVAMDSCFSGTDGILGKIRPLVMVSEEKVEGKLLVYSAADSKEISGPKEDQGHGLFTYYFLKGLNGEAADRKSGGVTAESLHRYVEARVAEAAHRDGNREQHPQFMHSSKQDGKLLLRDVKD